MRTWQPASVTKHFNRWPHRHSSLRTSVTKHFNRRPHRHSILRTSVTWLINLELNNYIMWHIQYDYFNTQVEETLFTEFVNVVINILSSCTQFMVMLIVTIYHLYLICITTQNLRNLVFSLQNINVVYVTRPENLHST